jgi:hypothetical protein
MRAMNEQVKDEGLRRLSLLVIDSTTFNKPGVIWWNFHLTIYPACLTLCKTGWKASKA